MDAYGHTNDELSSGESYVGLFVQMLGLDKDPLDREQAVVTLWKYSQGGKHCIDEIMKFRGSIILIINFLKSDSDLIREAAAGLLRNISSVKVYMESVVASGVIEEIVGLLHQSDLTPEVKEHSLCTLWNLSIDETYRMKIARSDIMPILIKYLDDEELKVKEAAGGVLSNLALSPCNHSTIVESGVIQRHKILRKEAKNVLLELSKDEYYKILIIEEGLVFVPLVGASAYKSFRPVSHSWPSLPDGTEIERTARFSRYGASELLLGLNFREKSLNLEEMKMHAIVGRSQQQFLARIGAIETEDDNSALGSLPNDRETILPWMDGVARLVLILGLEDVSAVKRAAWAIADSSISEHMSFKVSQMLDAERVLDPLINVLKSGCSSENLKEKTVSILSRILDPENDMKAKFSNDLVSGQNETSDNVSSTETEGEENADYLPEINAIRTEENGLAVGAASRLLTKLLNYELFHRSIDPQRFINLLREILKSEIPLHAKDWVAACLVKIESLVSQEEGVNYPLDVEVIIYEAIPRLVEQMRASVDEEVQEAAAVELNRIVSEGLPECTQAAVEACLAVLYNVCMDDENHSAVVAAGAVPVLRRVILSERPQWTRALHLLRTLPTSSDLS
ncbi:unnamed protein product [Spirodela intermedia]|uniref:Uncharacterized protein n=1 Tax=Spirodela intermedia TaxID=51605 RepID=A0A7I8IVT9_SPIIN|nr:unnamed protein product [Spirodela intermedia]CAA6661269.1 unnamed protein product [Spirodela intermedia]